ncbi:MAG: hypothetical protein ABJE66_13830 [Deltaproteobacteria bacterium]
MRPQEYSPRPRRHGWQDLFEPIDPPPPESIEVNSPIRDDSQIGLTEDLDREPDGVPHAVVGLTAFFSVMFALLVLCVFFIGSTVGKAGAILLLCLAVPLMISKLKTKSNRDRDHIHPSR